MGGAAPLPEMRPVPVSPTLPTRWEGSRQTSADWRLVGRGDVPGSRLASGEKGSSAYKVTKRGAKLVQGGPGVQRRVPSLCLQLRHTEPRVQGVERL